MLAFEFSGSDQFQSGKCFMSGSYIGTLVSFSILRAKRRVGIIDSMLDLISYKIPFFFMNKKKIKMFLIKNCE